MPAFTQRTPSSHARVGGEAREALSPSTSGVLLSMMLVCLLLPMFPTIGGLRFDPHRVFFLLTIVPFGLLLLSGRAGKLIAKDALMVFVTVWMILTYFYHHGFDRVPYAIVVSSEMLGGYLAGRILVRSARDYRRFIRYFFVSLLVMLPFAVYELFTFQAPIPELLGKFVQSQAKYLEARTSFNLSRVQVVFPHPILFGLYCSFALGNVFYIYEAGWFNRAFRVIVVGAMSWMSLSSAAILSMAFQLIMIVWGVVTRGKWKLLFVIVASAYVLLSMFSNRGPIILIIENLTLSPQTAWWRVHIWNYGTISVLNNPIMGIGMNDWVRPDWLAATVDNFWLVLAMRHGLPLIICFLLAIGIHVFRILRLKDLDSNHEAIRTGYMVSFIGLVLTLATVHVWNALAALVPFYIGAGAFLYTRDEDTGAVSSEENKLNTGRGGPIAQDLQVAQSRSQFTRFERRSRRKGAASLPDTRSAGLPPDRHT